MALTRDLLLERKASLEANRLQAADALTSIKEQEEQMRADLNALIGAIQQVSWDLEQLDILDAHDADVPRDGEKEE